MHILIFDLFTRMITDLPVHCVLKALELECNMLEDDVKKHRLPLPADAPSIFSFREFVQAAKAGQSLPGIRPLPPDHVEFLKRTVLRLIQANELPQTAMDQFDCAFSPYLK